MGRIVVLDQNVINMIAAGEVIERPASVVKELLENSIDAGATKITVCLEDGGRKLISVTDNGCGMDAADLRMAFESHSTSKVKNSSDLVAISTLGFRGEALASIASVAAVRATSRTKDSQTASCLRIDCGTRSEVRPCGGAVGTSIEVRDIFYKLPARRKFLKTANTELGHITEQLTRTALAFGGLEISLIHNGRELYNLPGNQDLRGRISQLFSSELAQGLLDADIDEKGLHIRALLARPGCSRSTGNLQYVFLNGRYVRDKFISHAVKEAYHGLIEADRFPVVFLFIRMPYESYDVNVHPTKIEVRFYNANLVHSQVLGALREKLLTADLTEHGRFPERAVRSESLAVQDQAHSQSVREAMTEFFKKYGAVASQSRFEFSHLSGSGGISRPGAAAEGNLPEATAVSAIAEPGRKYLQIHDTFIVTQTDEGLVIIDQHALHERILYENLYSRLTTGRLESQKLLIPENIELSDKQLQTLRANKSVFDKLGIELVPFGQHRLIVQAFPPVLTNADVAQFVRDLIDLLVEVSGKDFSTEKLLGDIVSLAACKGAIKAGQKLTDSEIERLLGDGEQAPRSSCCPHGRPTMLKFSIAQLEKQFKRT